MQVRCPQCHTPVELGSDSPLSEIDCPSCGSSFSLVGEDETVDYHDTATKTIGHFELLDPLGSGAFATVWKAKDTELDRTVAIKIPRKGELNAEETAKFLREARAAAQLRNPNIVSVHEVGREGDTVYIVSDYVEGLTLADWMTDQRLTPREAAELCAKIADALHHAHESGVVHRDLKPANIVLDATGEPHVMDFGLARREAGEVTMTVEGKVLGTPAYMSPEQARGEGHRADRRSDVYSLGVILFELLTSERPFRGNTRMLLHHVIHDDAPSPRRYNGNVPRDLETACLKCLEKEPNRRYRTARELAEELRRFLSGEPVRARPIRRLARGWRWCKRNPAIAGLAGAVVALLLVLAVAAPIVALGQFSLRRLADRQRERADNALRKETEARRQIEVTLADMYTSYGLVAAQRNNPQEGVLWFGAAANRAHNDPERELANRVRFGSWSRRFPAPVRAMQHQGTARGGLEFHPNGQYLMARTLIGQPSIWDLQAESALKLPSRSRPITAAAWSPIGDRLALGTSGGQVEIHSFPLGKLLCEILQPGPILALCFAPDGDFLAVAGKTVRVWDCQKQEYAIPELPHPALVEAVSFSSDGSRLATACADESVRVYALARSQVEPLFPPIPSIRPSRFSRGPGYPLFADGDRLLITVGADNEIACWDLESGKKVRTFPLREANSLPAICGAGQRSLFACDVFSIRQWDVADGQFIRRLAGHGNRVYQLAMSPDAQTMLSVSGDRTARLWSIPSGETLMTLPHQDEVTHAAFSPDGRCFATADRSGLIRVWAFPDPPEDHHILIEGNDHKVAVSALGRYAAPAGWGLNRDTSATRVYEIATGKPAGPVLDAGGLINQAAFSSDGRCLVTVSSLPEHRNQQDWRVIQWDRQPGQVIFWNWRTGERLLDPLQTVSEPIGVAYSPDDKVLVVVCAAGQILLLEPNTARIAKRLDHGGIARPAVNPQSWVQFAPSGERFATLGLGLLVRVWETATGRHCYDMTHDGSVRDVCYSPKGRWLATASDDKLARIFDASTGELAAPPLIHSDWVFSVQFSGDSTHLLTSCRDGSAQLWDWRTGKRICPAFEHEDEVFDADFSPDGRWILTTGRDGTLRVWDWRTTKPVTPTKKLSGARGCTVLLTPDGSRAVVVGETPALDIFDLRDLSEKGAPAIDLPSLQMFGEILSGRRVQGSGAVNLTSAEWHQAWLAFRSKHPDWHQLSYSPDGLIQWHRRKVQQCLEGKTWDGVVWHCDRLLELAPKSPSAWHDRGVARQQQGRYNEAIADLKRAVELGSDAGQNLAEAHESLGERRLEAGQEDQARKAFEAADEAWNRLLEACSDDTARLRSLADVHNNRGIAYLERNRYRPHQAQRAYAKAIAVLERLVESGSALEEDECILGGAHGNIGDAYRRLGETGLALKHYARSVAILEGLSQRDPPNSTACRFLGVVRRRQAMTLSMLGRNDELLALAAGLIESSGDSAEGYYFRAQAYAGLGEWEQAAADMRECVELGLDSVATRFHLALLWLQLDRLEDYRRACQEMIDQFGKTNDAETANTVAWACALGPDAVADLTLCVGLVQQAVAVDPENYPRLNTLGCILYRAGDFEKAIETLDEAIATHGGGGTWGDWLFLAMAHHRMGHREQAMQWLERTHKWIDESAVTDAKGEPRRLDLPWYERLELGLLGREAESLIQPEEPDPESSIPDSKMPKTLAPEAQNPESSVPDGEVVEVPKSHVVNM